MPVALETLGEGVVLLLSRLELRVDLASSCSRSNTVYPPSFAFARRRGLLLRAFALCATAAATGTFLRLLPPVLWRPVLLLLLLLLVVPSRRPSGVGSRRPRAPSPRPVRASNRCLCAPVYCAVSVSL